MHIGRQVGGRAQRVIAAAGEASGAKMIEAKANRRVIHLIAQTQMGRRLAVA
jgi:hypothetical protein